MERDPSWERCKLPQRQGRTGSGDPPAAMPRRCSSCLPLPRVMRTASGWSLRSIVACRLRERRAKSPNPAGDGWLNTVRARVRDPACGCPLYHRPQACPVAWGPMQCRACSHRPLAASIGIQCIINCPGEAAGSNKAPSACPKMVRPTEGLWGSAGPLVAAHNDRSDGTQGCSPVCSTPLVAACRRSAAAAAAALQLFHQPAPLQTLPHLHNRRFSCCRMRLSSTGSRCRAWPRGWPPARAMPSWWRQAARAFGGQQRRLCLLALGAGTLTWWQRLHRCSPLLLPQCVLCVCS